MAVVQRGDGRCRRLLLLVPLAVALAMLSSFGFLSLLLQAPASPRPPEPVEVSIAELAAPSEAAPPESKVEPSTPEPIAAAPSPEPPQPESPPPPEEEPPSPPNPDDSAVLDAQSAPPPPLEPPPPTPQRKPPTPTRPAPQRQVAPAAPLAAAPVNPASRLQQPGSPSAAPSASPQPLAGGSTGARALFQPMPPIPDDLRRHRIDAVAVVVFQVAADGSATVELREATDDPRLNQVLLDGFRRWRFFPALAQGRPVASTLELRVPIEVR